MTTDPIETSPPTPTPALFDIPAASLGAEVPTEWNAVGQVREAVLAVFPEVPLTEAGHPDVLFRVDRDPADPKDDSAVRLLVQTTAEPRPVEGLRMTALGPILDRLTSGATVEFRVVVNAVSATPQPKPEEGRGRRGVRSAVPLTPQDDFAEFRAWFERLLERSGGFDHVATEVVTPRRYALGGERRAGERTARRKWIDAVGVTGTATVADAEAARAVVLAGLGRSRISGCGLLTVVPAPARPIA